MVKGKDTLPYKEKVIIVRDTEYSGDKTYLPGDTMYEMACRTFEKINGKIVNQSDSTCAAFGPWITPDSSGNYWTGVYDNGYQKGIWRKFDKRGKLLREHEEVHIAKDVYTVKEVDYSEAEPKVIINKPFLAFYAKYFALLVTVLFVSFFSRVFINSKIYNIENDTNYSPISLAGEGHILEKMNHGLLSMFTIWFFTYRPENRQRVLLSHILSLIALGIFASMLIGLGIDGGLK